MNRPRDEREFMEGNFGFTSELLDILKAYNNTCPIMLASSIQAELDNPYGTSKRLGEDLLFAYSKETGAKVLVYRLPNVFGKWCKPNYNSVIATFMPMSPMGCLFRLTIRTWFEIGLHR